MPKVKLSLRVRPNTEAAAWVVDEIVLLEERIAELEFKAKAYDAMCEVGLIQYDENIENHIYSVWGFGAWHHDHDILKAIGAAMEPPRLKEPAQALQDKP